MKLRITILMLFAASSVLAQGKVAQSGTPAMLEATNGKKMRAFLQSMEGGNVTFQPFKSSKSITVPADKVSNLKFFPKYDAEGVNASFINGDYAGVITTLEALFSDYEQYMPIENNLQEAFCMMFDAYQAQMNDTRIRECAALLEQSNNPKLVRKAKAGLALLAVSQGEYANAEKITDELQSEAGRLYLKASTQRAQGEFKAAFETAVEIIASHANDLEWLPQSELLCANLYLDLTMTNSAIATARQVRNIYGGTNVAADAEKLFIKLGGQEKTPQEEGEEEDSAQEQDSPQ